MEGIAVHFKAFLKVFRRHTGQNFWAFTQNSLRAFRAGSDVRNFPPLYYWKFQINAWRKQLEILGLHPGLSCHIRVLGESSPTNNKWYKRRFPCEGNPITTQKEYHVTVEAFNLHRQLNARCIFPLPNKIKSKYTNLVITQDDLHKKLAHYLLNGCWRITTRPSYPVTIAYFEPFFVSEYTYYYTQQFKNPFARIESYTFGIWQEVIKIINYSKI